MSNHDHDRAIDLITRRGTEDLGAADLSWLEAHLEVCAECSIYAEAFDNTGRLLRTSAITASPALVANTQTRVRARATYLREQRSRTVLITISFCLGMCSSALSGSLWWRFGAWVAERLGWSPAIVEPGIFVAWMLPAVLIAAAMLASSHPVIDRSLLMGTGMVGEEREGGR